MRDLRLQSNKVSQNLRKRCEHWLIWRRHNQMIINTIHLGWLENWWRLWIQWGPQTLEKSAISWRLFLHVPYQMLTEKNRVFRNFPLWCRPGEKETTAIVRGCGSPLRLFSLLFLLNKILNLWGKVKEYPCIQGTGENSL